MPAGYKIIFVFLLLSTSSFAQDDSRLSLVLGCERGKSVSSNGIGLNLFNRKSVGIGYTNMIAFSFRLGIKTVFQSVNLEIKQESHGHSNPISEVYDINISTTELTFGVYMKKALFFQGGIVLDFELGEVSDKDYQPQNGIGILLGLGYDIHFENIVFTLNPIYKLNSAIRFDTGDAGVSSFGTNHGPLPSLSLNLIMSYKFF